MPAFGVCLPYPIVVFVLDGAELASSQGLAGTSDKRHPAAAKHGPKSMSSQKHSAGKVLPNQMGFLLHSQLFFTHSAKQAQRGFDADINSWYTDPFAPTLCAAFSIQG